MPSTAELASTTHLEDLASDLILAVEAPGAAIAVSVDGDPWTAGIGHQDFDRRHPMPDDALFSLYSMTKMFLATLVVSMEELKDSLRLDDTLRSWLPDFPIERPITLRQILNHTSGLPSYGRTPEYLDARRAHPERPWTRAEFLAHTPGDDLLFLPGHGWRYSNIGYLLIRQILEEETGLQFPFLMRQYLSRPFDLPSLGGVATLDDVQSLTPGYSSAFNDEGRVENIIPRFHPGWIANGLATGTAIDVARFLDALLGDRRIVSGNLVDDMLAGLLLGERLPWIVEPAYGLGLMLDLQYPDAIVAGYSGSGPGYSVAGYHFPNVAGHRVSAVALVNRDGSDVATDLVFGMARQLATALNPDSQQTTGW